DSSRHARFFGDGRASHSRSIAPVAIILSSRHRAGPGVFQLGKRIDILGLGAVAVDDFIYLEAYPAPDAKARVLRRERNCGGLTAIALVAAARLGARCAYAGVLGRDESSGFAVEFL